MKITDQPLIVEQTFNKSPEEIWNAITNHQEMIKWYFDNIPDFKPEVGFTTQFNIVSGERNFLHKWKVIKVFPNKKIVCNWTYENYEGSADVSFEIFSESSKSKLQVKVVVLENFNDDIPEFKRDSCVGGWEYFIQGRLKEYLS